MNEAGKPGDSVTVALPGRTLAELITSYQTHKVSSFHKLRYHNRKWQAALLTRISGLYGHFQLKDIRYVTAKEWHMDWLGPENKIAIAHAMVGALRTLAGFGLTLLEDEECERLSLVLRKLKLPQYEPRTSVMTAEQAIAIRGYARGQMRYSIALAQALQFELILRQKDILGEFIPVSEPGVSDVVVTKKRSGKTIAEKWMRGLRWEEIDQNMILRHVTSKKSKVLEIDLKMAPMVIEELGTMDRSLFPASGPIIISESTGLPYHADDFRRKWRLIADMAGVPEDVQNRDSRAGGISEARDAGADIENVREAATHADVSQTRDYDRNKQKKISDVQAKRLEYRTKKVG